MRHNIETISAKEAAKFLGISYWSLLKLVREGNIPHVRLGKKVLFRTSSLESFLDISEKSSTQKNNDTI